MEERSAGGTCRMGVSACVRTVLLVRYPPPCRQWLGRAKVPPPRVGWRNLAPRSCPAELRTTLRSPWNLEGGGLLTLRPPLTRRREFPLLSGPSALCAASPDRPGRSALKPLGAECPRNGPNLSLTTRAQNATPTHLSPPRRAGQKWVRLLVSGAKRGIT